MVDSLRKNGLFNRRRFHAHSSLGRLLILTLAASAGAYARTTLSPVQEAMTRSLDLTDGQAALLQGPALALPMVLTALPLGMLIDRYSRVRLLAYVLAITAIGNFLTAFAPGFASLFAARSLVGALGVAVNPIALSLIADLFRPDMRGRSTMAIAVGGYGGMSAAFALGGLLLGVEASVESWRWTMAWLTVPILMAFFFSLSLSEPSRGQVSSERSSPGTFSQLWTYRQLIAPVLGGLMFVEIAIGAVLVWTVPAFTRVYSSQPQQIGSIMGLAVLISGIVGPLIGGMLADSCQRRGGTSLILKALSLLMLGAAPLGLFPLAEVSLASFGLIAFVTLISAAIVILTTLFTLVIPSGIRGLGISLMMAVSALFGIGLAPLAVSVVSDALGGGVYIANALAIVGSGACLLASFFLIMGRAPFKQRGEKNLSERHEHV